MVEISGCQKNKLVCPSEIICTHQKHPPKTPKCTFSYLFQFYFHVVISWVISCTLLDNPYFGRTIIFVPKNNGSPKVWILFPSFCFFLMKAWSNMRNAVLREQKVIIQARSTTYEQHRAGNILQKKFWPPGWLRSSPAVFCKEANSFGRPDDVYIYI